MRMRARYVCAPHWRLVALNVEEMQRAYRAKLRAEAIAANRHRAVALELIASGFKREAAKVHPDHGGTCEQMFLLTETRDLLQKLVRQTWPLTYECAHCDCIAAPWPNRPRRTCPQCKQPYAK